jgi:hypothetical protein
MQDQDKNHLPMNERETFESVKRDIKHAIQTMRAKMPEAAEYLEKHIVMDDQKMTFAYTGDGRIRLEQLF